MLLKSYLHKYLCTEGEMHKADFFFANIVAPQLIFNWKSIQLSCTFVVSLSIAVYQQVRDSLSKPTNRCFHHFCEKELFWTRQRVALSANGEATLHAQMLYWFENSLSVRIDFLCFPLSSCTEYCSENTRKAKWFNNHVTRPCYQYNEVRTLEHSPDVISKLFFLRQIATRSHD